MSQPAPPEWLDVGTPAAVARRKKVVVESGDHQVLVIAHDGGFHALQNLCIHKDRDLSRGVVLNGRLICPGHQWAFDLATGWESIKQECQPTYAVRVHDDVVQVDLASRRALGHSTAVSGD